MAGRLELEYLAEQVEHGEVDTVVAAFTDMQGRLVGKRVTGRFFLDVGRRTSGTPATTC